MMDRESYYQPAAIALYDWCERQANDEDVAYVLTHEAAIVVVDAVFDADANFCPPTCSWPGNCGCWDPTILPGWMRLAWRLWRDQRKERS